VRTFSHFSVWYYVISIVFRNLCHVCYDFAIAVFGYVTVLRERLPFPVVGFHEIYSILLIDAGAFAYFLGCAL
jgi:hypothetical protein